MLVKAVIIDDEQNNIDNLFALLQKHCKQVSILATAKNAEEAELMLLQHIPDLVFLDIQMPGKNGFELLQSLHDRMFEVIFVTAYDQFGIQAVKFSALDYLLKPVAVEELKKAVQKAIDKVLLKSKNVQLENLIELLQQQQHKEEHRLALTTLKETRFVFTKQIIHCISSNNYTTFYLTTSEKLIVSKPIFEYEELLSGYGFIRCHQSHLVNKKYIKSWIKEDGGYLLLENLTQVPVSRNKKETLKKELGELF